METGIEKVSTTLSVLPITKEEIMTFSQKIIDGINDGDIHPFELKKVFKSMELVQENVKSTLDEAARSEAEKYGAKEFEAHGMKIVLAENGTRYDYSNCNDPVLTNMQLDLDNLTTRVKNRQKLLQGLKEPTLIGGDLLNPAVKSSTSGVRISLL